MDIAKAFEKQVIALTKLLKSLEEKKNKKPEEEPWSVS